MRISKGRGWLAVVALALGTAAQADFVSFSTTDFTQDYDDVTPAILLLENVGTRQFSWTASGVVVQNVTLYAIRSGTPDNVGYWDREKTEGELGDHDTPATRGGSRLGTGSPWPHDIARRSLETSVFPNLSFDSNVTGGYVSGIKINSINAGEPLYFQANWTGGYSHSRLFTMVSGLNPPLPNAQIYHNATPYLPESHVAAAILGGDETPSSGNPNTDSGSAKGGNLSTPEDSPKDSSEDIPKSANSGLPQGAIIGIAVGCGVAGLLAIAALVWFLLRRRQQKKALLPVDSAYSSANRADELMAEKEASADVDVSPHSPYSDEGASAGGVGGVGGGGGVGTGTGTGSGSVGGGEAVATGAAGAAASFNSRQHLQDPPRSFTPYSDRPGAAAGAAAGSAGTPSVRAASMAQTDEARVSVPSPIPGRATPRALTTPYAHLVEDGMTEDEIRRLEEEERQLDAAIEQAGRR